MTDLDNEDELPRQGLLHRSRPIAWVVLLVVSPLVSIGCAILVGYFTHIAANQKPPEDVSSLAISILKSDEASPEMRSWAKGVIGLRTDVPMPIRLTSQ